MSRLFCSFLQEGRGKFDMPNELAGEVFLTSEDGVFEGHLTLRKHGIVDCSAFYDVAFFCISPKSLLEDFFHRLNESPGLKAKA